MHCGIQVFVLEINKLPCIPNGIGIASSVLTYKTRQTRFLPVQYFCNMMANKMVQNHLILFTYVNVLHTFQKVKGYVFHGYFAFSSIQTVHVFIMI